MFTSQARERPMSIGSRRRLSALGTAVLSAWLLAGCQGAASPLRNPSFQAGSEPANAVPTPPAAAPAVEGAPVDFTLPPLPESPEASQASAAPAPTPLLDAALARAEAQKRVLVDDSEATSSTAAAPPPEVRPLSVHKPAIVDLEVTVPSTSLVPTDPPAIDPDAVAAAAPAPQPAVDALPSTAEPANAVEREQDEARAEPAPAPPVRDVQTPSAPASSSVSPSPASPSANASSTEAAPAPNESLAITDLRLCRRVLGFGSFEPIDPSACKAGQHVIVYSELTGVGWREDAGKYSARLASDVEVLPADGDEPIWRQSLGTADDTCTHRRHDFYVNDRLTLPTNLLPGAYRLRLIQRDLVAGCEASSILSFSILP
jgi:hypothetical protein